MALNYYHIACKYVTPLYRMLFNFKIYGAENLRTAAELGRVVVCTTHSSDLGGMIVGMAVSSTLKTEPYIVVNDKFRRNRLTHFFLRKMNIIWIMGNNMQGNLPALKEIRHILTRQSKEVIIIAPQGIYNKPLPEYVDFRQGFAIPCLQVARVGIHLSVVPAIDVGATYKGMPMVGRRIAAVFGKPISVQRSDARGLLTRKLEDAVRQLMSGTVLDNLTFH